MNLSNLILIASLEVAAVLLIVCILLTIRNSSLKKLVNKMQARMEQLVKELRTRKQDSAPPPPPPQEPAPSYDDLINAQIQNTKDHHTSLGSEQDIVLDLAPDIPMPLRATALRHAILIAEKEALALSDGDEPDWSVIRTKYEQIFSFFEDFSEPSPENTDQGVNPEELEALEKDLENARKRISNLEKFKKLYFEMEEAWEASKKEAKTHYDNLSEMASQVDDTVAFESALENYQSSYGKFNNLFQDTSAATTEIITVSDPGAASEIQHLRTVAADQHRIISELQAQLEKAQSAEEKTELIDNLKEELNKQARFVQESETCIQLMEDELNSANKEMDILRSRLKALPSLKEQLKDVTSQKDSFELKVYALTSEKRKLEKQLKENKGSISSGSSEDTTKLKKSLADMETRYAELEEKYLDLKLQQ